MHEAALAAPLVRLILEETARQEELRETKLCITRVKVKAGLLTGVEAQTLQGIFALMTEGTKAQGADLIVETLPMIGSCPDCGATDLKTQNPRDFRCSQCRGENVDWIGGNELYIASIEVKPRA